MAKKQQTKTTRAKSKSYSRNKGHAYETKIAKELRELGFTGIVTSRSESKSADDNKVDLVDTTGKFKWAVQLKKTQNIPSYFDIRESSTVNNKDFILFWAKQKKKDINICTVGECVILDKELFYELIKSYAKSEN